MDQKQVVRSLFDELSASYDSTGIDFFGQIARTLIRHARLREGFAVLDVGCGAGAALIAAAEAVGPAGRVVGVDLARGMVERAQRAVDASSLDNVRVDVGDAESPPVDPGSFDAIVASLVLFFLPNIDAALDAYSAALVRGGTLAFSTFLDNDDWAPLDRILEGFAPESARAKEDAWFESSAAIAALLSAHGFVGICSEEMTHHVEFPTLAAFHEWSWSTGYRAVWMAMVESERDAARAAADTYLESLRQPDGGIRIATGVRYTRAET